MKESAIGPHVNFVSPRRTKLSCSTNSTSPQVLWNPIFGIMFFSYVACLEWKGIDYVVEKTKNELMTQASDPPALGLGGLFGKGG